MSEPAAPPAPERGFDYVIVGAGAGGAPLAANLALAGMRVLLLEAGIAQDGDAYRVPAFHGDASEDPAVRWDYFVRHYADEERQRRDSKLVSGKGVLYPRAGTVGGCTAHHALITVYPYNADWDGIAEATGDASWRSSAMRGYFERLERCEYRPRPKELPPVPVLGPLLNSLVKKVPYLGDRYANRSRHGFDGWLPTNLADPALVVQDAQLLKVVLAAAEGSLADLLGRRLTRKEGLGSLVDPNDWQAQSESLEGLWRIPLSTTGGHRSAARERVLSVQAAHPDRLVIRQGALATRIVLDEHGAARGIDYVRQAHAYRADPAADAAAEPLATHRVLAEREVVLAAGAFNTPQLLMLSGIGPRDELARHGIEVRADRQGVGANLQDRYEVGVVSQLDRDFAVLKDCSFHPPQPGATPDRCYQDWQRGEGVYTTNGAVIAVIRKSRRDLDVPDLFLFGIPADFRGYYPGYSQDTLREKNRFTWAVLKSRTHNNGGRVRLRSADPRDTPVVNFHHFTEGTDTAGHDLEAMADAVAFVRHMNRRAGGVIRTELWPGPAVASRDQVRRWVQDEAWGHHASCTCKMGPADDPTAVVDSRFRVHGVDRLRIVDASVFPRIPGFFIATPIYMISEKASDVLLADATAHH
ncbi:GMC family oxidoreductase [Streptomyces olivaceiscleroticus]|uniref:Choline dehydrogenase n=1 Tax=Streptomyces olivaceiscleroticus TaxID=68245 RepID=A0ABN0ZTW9_9ACTN